MKRAARSGWTRYRARGILPAPGHAATAFFADFGGLVRPVYVEIQDVTDAILLTRWNAAIQDEAQEIVKSGQASSSRVSGANAKRYGTRKRDALPCAEPGIAFSG